MTHRRPSSPQQRPVPTSGQLAWQQTGLGVFFHFGLNTFHSLEWSDGTLDPATFDPDRLDADQWVRTAKQAGAGYVVLTAKHHDGFCLWPTATTDYSVRSAPWRDGEGDVVGEVADACRRHDIGLGLYLSPWDRNAACYPDPEAYDEFYLAQLNELCTHYGELYELWFDGAGSQGRTYDWPRIAALIDRTQPQAMVFNMGRPTIRWVGNEDGLAADPVCYVVPDSELDNYTTVTVDTAEQHYLPPECDVSLRRGWFFQPDEHPKTVEHLLAIYYRSIGLGANLLLNLPPDWHGVIPDTDVARVTEWRTELDRRFGEPRRGRLVTADDSSKSGTAAQSVSGEHPAGSGQAHDPAHEVCVDLGGDDEIDHLELTEDLTGGQQVDSHQVCTTDGRVLATGRTVGIRRLHTFPTVRTGHLTLRLRDGDNAPLDASALASVTGYRTGHSAPPQLPSLAETPTVPPE